jgi:hypothetical protein
MKELLIGILQKFKYVKELDFYWHSTHKRLHALQSRETKRKYDLCYGYEGVSVDMCVKHKDVHNLEEYTWCTIKVFPYGDDVDYAELCAKELLEKLNEEV